MIEPEYKLGGIVEVDETFVGGKDQNKHFSKRSGGRGGSGSGKTPVIGAVSRKGNVIARVLQHVTRLNAETFVREMVSNKVSLLATDENPVYDDLDRISARNRAPCGEALCDRRRAHEHD